MIFLRSFTGLKNLPSGITIRKSTIGATKQQVTISFLNMKTVD